jgi:hypothetical protein
MLALQIGCGIWLGAGLIAATVWVVTTIVDRIKRNTRYGAPWWRGLLWGD